MSGYWNSRIKNLSPYIPGEQPGDRQFIKLNTNENPYPPSPKVIEAIQKAANDRLRLYPDPECTELREAIAARYGVNTENVFAGNGSDEILAFTFGAFFESSGAENTLPLLFPDISYSFYPVYANLWNIKYRAVSLLDDFTINLSAYRIPSCGAVLSNPNAPTGIALPADGILALAAFLEKQGKVLALDEAYCAFGAESVVAHIVQHPNLITVHTLSKSASLAGLRTGFAIGNAELIEALRRIRDSFNSYTLDRLAQAGAAAAIKDAAYYDKVNRQIIATRDRVTRELLSLGFTVLPSSANFLFIKAPNHGGLEFYSLLRGSGILVRHFNRDRIADYLRVSIGRDEEMDVFLELCARQCTVNSE